MAIFLSSQDISSLISMKDCIETIEKAYLQAGEGQTTMLPRVTLDTPRVPRFLKMLPASFAGWEAAGIHIYTVSGSGTLVKVILIFDIPSGDLQAVVESDRIGWLVPGALSAVATQYLARKDARVLAVFGSGRQARSQVLSIPVVRPLELIKIYSPQKSHRENFCNEMRKLLGINMIAVDSPEEAIKGSDILSTTTNSPEPIFDGNWVEPGTHINAIGAHRPDRRELDSVCIQRSKVVVDSRDRALKEEGELLIPIREKTIVPDHIYGELGEIVAGQKPGRVDEKERTVLLSGGTGIEYVAMAIRLFQEAQKRGIGQELKTEKDPAIPKSLYLKERKMSR